MYSSIGILLLAAVAGYFVLERASRQKGQLRQVGLLVGSVVIVVSLFGVGCKVWALTSGTLGCYAGKMCPYSFKRAPSAIPAQQ